MVWPIDAPKGRFPSKIAHYRGEGRGTPIYPAAYPQPDTPTSHNSTTHANQVRSATSHCCVPTAASRQWALQPRRLLLTPLAALQHCRPSAAVRCSRRHPIIVLPASAQHSSIKGVGARGSCVRGAAIIPERKKSSDANKEQPLTGPPRHEVQPAAAALECSLPFCTVKRRPLQNGVLGLCLCEARPQLQQPTTMSNSISLKSVQRTASGRLERQLQRMPCCR